MGHASFAIGNCNCFGFREGRGLTERQSYAGTAEGLGPASCQGAMGREDEAGTEVTDAEGFALLAIVLVPLYVAGAKAVRARKARKKRQAFPITVQCGDGKVFQFPGEREAKQFEAAAKKAGAATFRLEPAGRTRATERPRPAKPAAPEPQDRARTSDFLEACLSAVAADSALGKGLWQNLLLKVGHDKPKAVRLVQLEIDELKRSALPEESFVALMQRAIERWERENRG
jgi:hypothetical protein